MTRALGLLVAALGGFALVAQTLLFRTYLGALGGTEIALGAFFASWLLWVGVGAVFARGVLGRGRPAVAWLAGVSLLYLPAFALERVLLGNLHALAGLPAFEVMPLGRLLLVTAVATSPVSVLTGFLFPLACQCLAARAGLPVARVWILEVLGAAVGGAVATASLAAGFLETSVFLGAGLLLALAVGGVLLVRPGVSLRRRVGFASILPLTLAVAWLARVDAAWSDAEDRATWSRTLPESAWRGALRTPSARYLHGAREGQTLVLGWSGALDVLPDRERAAETAALHLVQQPRAERVLVVGDGGLALGRAFLHIPHVRRFVWVHPDPAYPHALARILPAAWRPDLALIEMPGGDARTWIECGDDAFDLVVLSLPETTTLALNRYATREFYESVARVLAPGGVVSLRIPGGENVVGPELALLGASAWRTLASVFSEVVLCPGETTWLLATKDARLTTDATALEARWLSVDGGDDLFPAELVATLYPPARVAWQTERYRRAMEGASDAFLVSTDDHPKATLFALGLALRRAGWRDVSETLRVLSQIAFPLAWISLAVFAGLGLARRWGGVAQVRTGRGALEDALILAASAGFLGMALAVVLMFLHQARFGSLYLEVGLLSALFMLGLAVGGGLVRRGLTRARAPGLVLLTLVVFGVAVLAFVAWTPIAGGRLLGAFAFALAGVASGAFVPFVAWRLEAVGQDALTSGARLETADHLGGALGALAVGLFLLPLIGIPPTLLVLALLLAANLVPQLLPRRAQPALAGERGADRLRAVGAVLLAVVCIALVGDHLLARVEAGEGRRRFEDAAKSLARGEPRVSREGARPDESTFSYFELPGEDGDAQAWIFDTADLAPEVEGWGGALALAVRMERGGRLAGFRIYRQTETPVYLEFAQPWLEDLEGRDLLGRAPLADVDALTGASVTTDAVKTVLIRSSALFAASVLGRATSPVPVVRQRLWDGNFVLLLVLAVLALVLRRRPSVWRRRAFLLLVLVLLGFVSNLQYSSVQVSNLLRGTLPTPAFTGIFFLLVIVPVLVLLVGNVYCGYLCPFGAAQELVGDLRRKAWRLDPDPNVWQGGRALKYGLLALLLLLVVLSGRRVVLAADPLVSIFSAHPRTTALFLGLLALIFSLGFGRFWCRNLCPAGAFLALLNRAKLLRRLVPAPRPGRCDLGVRHHWELDCICCDRCRHEDG